MAIVSESFGGLRLSGDDAKKFQRQFTYGRSSVSVKAMTERGNRLAKAIALNGFAKVDGSAA